MLNTANLNAAQAAYDRIADTEQYLRRHGASLCDVLDAFEATAALDAFSELHGFLSSQLPNPKKIQAALQQVKTALCNQSSESAVIRSCERGWDTDAALRWHGARVSELLGRFTDAV